MREAYVYIIFFSGLNLYGSAGRSCAPCALAHLAFAVDIDFEVAYRLYVHHHFARLPWPQHCLILCTEVGEVHSGCKLIVAGRGLCKRSSIVFGSDRIAFASCVVPECAFDAASAFEAELVEYRCHNLVVGEVATGQVLCYFAYSLHAFEYGDGACRCAVIVAPHHRAVVGIRTYHSYLLLCTERQGIALVAQEGHGLSCHLECKVGMLLAFED